MYTCYTYIVSESASRQSWLLPGFVSLALAWVKIKCWLPCADLTRTRLK